MLIYSFLTATEDLENFTSRDVDKYDYLVLVDIPDGLADAGEINLMRSALERFMKRKSLVVFAAELKQTSDGAYIRSIYGSVFGEEYGKEACVSVATLHENVSERLYFNPVHHVLVSNEEARFPFYDALNCSLKNLRLDIDHASIEEVALPELHHTLKDLVIPNGRAVEKYRKEQKINQIDFAADCGVDRKIISKVEHGSPVKLATMELIADKTDKTVDDLLYTRVVPLRKTLIQLRENAGLTPDETAQKTGLPSGSYIQQLENAASVPGWIMRTVHYLYEKHLLNKSIPFSALIDLDATDKFPPDIQ